MEVSPKEMIRLQRLLGISTRTNMRRMWLALTESERYACIRKVRATPQAVQS
jgi:hypothetical protein